MVLEISEILKCPKCHSDNTLDKPREYYPEQRSGSMKGKRKPKVAMCKACGYSDKKWRFQRGIMTDRPVAKRYCPDCRREVYALAREHNCLKCGAKTQSRGR